MSQENLFRIGGVYRQKNGEVVKCGPCSLRPDWCIALLRNGPDGDWDALFGSARRLTDGKYAHYTGPSYDVLTLIPGELHNVNGEWVPINSPVQDPLPESISDALMDMIDPRDQRMIDRDGPTKVKAAPAPVLVSTAHPAIAGLSRLSAVDHRFGLSVR